MKLEINIYGDTTQELYNEIAEIKRFLSYDVVSACDHNFDFNISDKSKPTEKRDIYCLTGIDTE